MLLIELYVLKAWNNPPKEHFYTSWKLLPWYVTLYYILDYVCSDVEDHSDFVCTHSKVWMWAHIVVLQTSKRSKYCKTHPTGVSIVTISAVFLNSPIPTSLKIRIFLGVVSHIATWNNRMVWYLDHLEAKLLVNSFQAIYSEI